MTVLALEASLPMAVRKRSPTWRLAGRTSSELSSEDLAGILSDMGKPVVCSVASGEFPVGLSCEYLTAADDMDDYSRSLVARSSIIIEGIRREYAVADSDEVISFRNRYTGASMLVSLQDLKTWFKDYYLRSGTLVVREPDEMERQERAVTVVELGSSEGLRGEIEYHR